MMEFPHVITLEEETSVSDGAGGHESSWQPFKTVNAFVQPISGKTFFHAQKIESEINHKVFMVYDEDVKSNMRVLYKGKPLTIDNIIDQGGLNEILVLMCVGEG
jgi:SPP1 family predicted phage head-tail adaptor